MEIISCESPQVYCYIDNQCTCMYVHVYDNVCDQMMNTHFCLPNKKTKIIVTSVIKNI